MADSRRVGPNANNSQGTRGTQGSSQIRRPSYQRNDRGRRSWTDREEAVLISAMKDLVAQGWKSDNGSSKIEEWMQTEFPRTDIKANPHIQSKLTALKKHYNLLSNILDRSGVGFKVHGDFKIDYSDDQWDQIVKQDKEYRGMRTRSWPFWDDWKLIFGKDRANGRNAEGVVEATKNSSPDEPVTEIGESIDYLPSFDDFIGEEQVQEMFGNNVVDDSSAHSGQNTSGPSQAPPKPKRKRKVSDDDSGFIDVLGKMHTETNTRLDTLAAWIGYEMDLEKARKEIFRYLCDIPELSEVERYDLCDIIGKENSRLEIFTGLPDSSKPGYVKRVLEKETRT